MASKQPIIWLRCLCRRCPIDKNLFSVRSGVRAFSSTLQDITVASSPLTRLESEETPIDFQKIVKEFAFQDPTMISVQDLLQTGDIMANSPQGLGGDPHTLGRLARRLASERVLMDFANLLKQELPIRLAHRIRDLDEVPQMRHMPSVKTVKRIYIDSFRQILDMRDPTTPDLEEAFASLLQTLYQKHSDVLLLMARGSWELKSKLRTGEIPSGKVMDDNARILFAQQEECHAFLNRFYASRVGIRVLAGQYLALRQQLLSEDSNVPDPISSNYIGMICQQTSPYKVVQKSIHDAKRLCVAQFGSAPSVEVRGRLDLAFPYIPTHLHYILLELLKNALRATMETHSESVNKPNLVVIIADNTENEDVIIKVSDEGGGIPRSQMDHIWSYLYTTANSKIQENFLKQMLDGNGNVNIPGDAPVLAGLGYGLPMSRAYARYFGGDLDIISMEGYGTDAFCHLVRLGDRALSV